ncbi:MAG: hypothetical protein AAF517_21910 [Planctomycetota bacterium]
MRARASFLWAGACLSVWISGVASASPELGRAEFDKLKKELVPSSKALWRTIPWKISLLGAQRIAAEERKPLFIWAMDGHPLGCT